MASDPKLPGAEKEATSTKQKAGYSIHRIAPEAYRGQNVETRKRRAPMEPSKDRGFNPSNVVKLLSMRFPLEQSDQQFNDAEESMCTSIIEYILGVREADESLIFRHQDSDSSNDDESSGEDFAEIEETKRKLTAFKYSRTQMERIVRDYDENGLSFAKIQHQYKMVKSRADFARMRKYVNHFGRLEEAEIKDDLLITFQDWVRKGYHINDRDLHLEALDIARRKNHANFKASTTFIAGFKKRNNIVSRKVTHSSTTKQFVDVEHQKIICQEFRDDMKSLISSHPSKNKIFNSDQTGLKLELRAGRTLAIKGSKHIRVVAQRENALTHSLTLQPVISADGFLHTPVVVCFLERHPPAKFREELAEFQFLHYIHSTSGMMTSDLACNWIADVFLPNGGEDSVLLVDSWTGYSRAMNEFGAQNRQIEFHIIPPHTTGDVQPLDVFFNRQLKAFHRHLTELLCRLRPDFVVSVRRNLAKMLNLLIFQFTATRFRPMIQLAWQKAGLMERANVPFLTPDSFCFNFPDVDSLCHCGRPVVFKCAHCSELFCIDHTIVLSTHICNVVHL